MHPGLGQKHFEAILAYICERICGSRAETRSYGLCAQPRGSEATMRGRISRKRSARKTQAQP